MQQGHFPLTSMTSEWHSTDSNKKKNPHVAFELAANVFGCHHIIYKSFGKEKSPGSLGCVVSNHFLLLLRPVKMTWKMFFHTPELFSSAWHCPVTNLKSPCRFYGQLSIEPGSPHNFQSQSIKKHEVSPSGSWFFIDVISLGLVSSAKLQNNKDHAVFVTQSALCRDSSAGSLCSSLSWPKMKGA